jgi:hypothetical protein
VSVLHYTHKHTCVSVPDEQPAIITACSHHALAWPHKGYILHSLDAEVAAVPGSSSSSSSSIYRAAAAMHVQGQNQQATKNKELLAEGLYHSSKINMSRGWEIS